MKKSDLKQIIKEEIVKILSENAPQFKIGDTFMFRGTKHKVLGDTGYVVKAELPNGKQITYNYNQLKGKVMENLAVTEPGRYLVDYIASEMDGGPSHPDSTVITLEPYQLEKLNPEFPDGFWKDRVEDMTGNIPYKITSVTKA
jgi:hypothetical protein